MKDGSSRDLLLRSLPLIVIVLVAVVAALTLRDVISFESLKLHRDALVDFRDRNYLVAVALFILAYVAIVTLSLPGATVATLAGGFMFGLFPGVLLNVCAATAGAWLIFLAARRGVGARVEARLARTQGRVRRLHAGLRRNELSFLFLMRLIPLVPFFVANVVPALFGTATRRFVVTTFLGIIPGTLAYTWVGAGLDSVVASGRAPDLGIIFQPVVLGPLAVLSVLALLPVLLRGRDGTEGEK